MEIKLAAYNFKRDENRKYDQIVRRLNKPNETPIHFFAFTTDYDDDAVPKCPHCRTYLFPQEVSKAMWCCKKGHMPYAIVIQAVDTANRRIQKPLYW